MVSVRKKLDASFKARIVLKAIREDKTVSELASLHGVHPKMIYNWRKQVLENLSGIFSEKRQKIDNEKDNLVDELYRQIG